MDYSKEEIIKAIDRYCKSFNDYDFGNPEFIDRCHSCKLYSICIAHNKRSDMEDYEFQYAEYILKKYDFLQTKQKLVEIPKEYLDYLKAFCAGVPESKCTKQKCKFYEICNKYEGTNTQLIEENDMNELIRIVDEDKAEMCSNTVDHVKNVFNMDTAKKLLICLAYYFRARDINEYAKVYEYLIEKLNKENN